jgi:hypothetical protein
VLAFIAWHRPTASVERAIYENALERFHRSLAHQPPSGFRGSASARVEQVPWLDGAVYEDWYVIEDWAALGVLEEAALSHGHRSAHDAAAALTGMETAAVYRLLEGSADPGRAASAARTTARRWHRPRARRPVAALPSARARARVLPAGGRGACRCRTEPAAPRLDGEHGRAQGVVAWLTR